MFSCAEAVATSQLDRLEPELAGVVLSFDVHVRRLIAVEAGEEDPIRPRDALILGIAGYSLLFPSAQP